MSPTGAKQLTIFGDGIAGAHGVLHTLPSQYFDLYGYASVLRLPSLLSARAGRGETVH